MSYQRVDEYKKMKSGKCKSMWTWFKASFSKMTQLQFFLFSVFRTEIFQCAIFCILCVEVSLHWNSASSKISSLLYPDENWKPGKCHDLPGQLAVAVFKMSSKIRCYGASMRTLLPRYDSVFHRIPQFIVNCTNKTAPGCRE